MSRVFPDDASRLGIVKFLELLRGGVDVEQRDTKGRTALFRAARIGREEHVRALIGHGADVNATDATGEAPLQTAARYGHLNCIELLAAAGANLDHCPPPETTEYSESALCSAARKATDAALLLLSLGADPNASTTASRYPLITAIDWKRDERLVRALLKSGADVNVRDDNGGTALHAAVRAESVPMIRLLLEAGADPEIEDSHSGTPLCTAVLGHTDECSALVIALLSANPNLNSICPSWEMTPIELANHYGLVEVIEILKAAGSPNVRREKDYSNTSKDTVAVAWEGTAKIEIRVVSSAIPTSSADFELAREVCDKPPALCRRFGWQGSPGHWGMLDALERCGNPIPLARIAYFVRGFRNAPEGLEFADGVALLGESYHEAAARMMEAGLLRMVADEEALVLTHSLGDFKKVAAEHGLKISGSKTVLATRLRESLGLPQLLQELPSETHFVIEPAGESALEDRDLFLSEIASQLRGELLDLLKDNEFVWACHIAKDLDWITSGRSCVCLWRDAANAVGKIARARSILDQPLPTEFEHLEAHESRLRWIRAASSLILARENDWADWDLNLGPIHDESGKPMSPNDFGNRMIRSVGSAADEF